jgi:peptidoglycan/xylan/chitin deacetylase (PgdA/CDA1 family)
VTTVTTVTTAIPVLLYHSVCATRVHRDPWCVDPATFRDHVEIVTASGRPTSTISALADGLRDAGPLAAGVMAVTFDDGFADVADAVDELVRAGIAATVYVTAGLVDTRGMLSSGALADLARLEGVEVGAHAVRHVRLDELPRREAEREVAESRDRLEDRLQMPVQSFAYPHGAYDRHVRASVLRSGYRSAAAVKNALSHPADDPFAIARWTVSRATRRQAVAAVLEGRGARVSDPRERARTRAFRTVRRVRRLVAGPVPPTDLTVPP